MASPREWALFGAGVALELAAVAAGAGGLEALALAAHGAACAGLSLGLRRALVEGRGGWTLLFVLAAFLPVIGALGLAATALLRSSPDAPPAPELLRARIPGPRDAAASRVRADGLAAARARTDPRAIALLRRTIGAADEDVRLVAHAVLESKGRAADRRIRQAARALEAAPPERRGGLHRLLAAEHWELAWLGLAQGEHLAHALEEARRHCLLALAGDSRQASLHFLLGRIELRRGEPALADAALERAVRLGFPDRVARPYLAEAAFLQRRLDRVRDHLAAASGSGGPAVDRVRRYWT
jgi:hypothetical protein